MLYRSVGQYDSALAYLGQASRVMHELRDRQGEAGTLANIALVYEAVGAPDSALALFHRGLPVFRDARSGAGVRITLNNIGEIHRRLGQSDSAGVYFTQALAPSPAAMPHGLLRCPQFLAKSAQKDAIPRTTSRKTASL